MTRRRILAILPAFLAALLVQIYAPAGSALAIARAHQQTVAQPCAMHANHAEAERTAPHSHDAACDLCDFVFSGAAPLAFDPPPTDFTRAAPHRLTWTLPTALRVASARRTTAQARAPPSAS
ncbi:hypothetical protein M2323_001672 [Rhodoblastus acidophilus]|uniref:DUF2946 family protein n=1 Tax=Rhodoblastus acidophilus TaxID=1074 RepID=UPI00222589AF|nr:DUF2946 family protein [Rhodoblastus acidophilus]MCW2284059.1 hypothetical protein [Rhodoblastus acidophilus]MCW2332755.1 hypothetical protein [Rhodoblastus acidophilus]